ncbi:hypothetical protein GF326_08055 [Candidatus Bathyarchaeota archaeon]|nr:hypothetical protein [Candidatus Bathyarchaeota archaeon]
MSEKKILDKEIEISTPKAYRQHKIQQELFKIRKNKEAYLKRFKQKEWNLILQITEMGRVTLNDLTVEERKEFKNILLSRKSDTKRKVS